MKKVFFAAIFSVALSVVSFVAGFVLGEKSEASDKNSIAQQYRGWLSLASVTTGESFPDSHLPDTFGLHLFVETYAMAMRMGSLEPWQLDVFKQKASLLARAMPEKLRDHAGRLANCILEVADDRDRTTCVHAIGVTADSVSALMADRRTQRR